MEKYREFREAIKKGGAKRCRHKDSFLRPIKTLGKGEFSEAIKKAGQENGVIKPIFRGFKKRISRHYKKGVCYFVCGM